MANLSNVLVQTNGILGLTEKRSTTSGLPLIGTIHKGAPKPKNSKKPGADLDHFRVDFNLQYQSLMPHFVTCYGHKPKQFKVITYGHTPDAVFQASLAEYQASGLVHKCNGAFRYRWRNDKGVIVNGQSECLAQGQGCGCKANAQLYVVLPEFSQATGVLGTFRFTTTSKWDIITISDALNFLLESYGSLHKVPFIVGRAPQKKTYPTGDGGRAPRTYNLMYVQYHTKLLELSSVERQPLLDANQPELSLPAGDDEIDLHDYDVIESPENPSDLHDDEPDDDNELFDHVQAITGAYQKYVDDRITYSFVVEALNTFDVQIDDTQPLPEEIKFHVIAAIAVYTYVNEEGEFLQDLAEEAIAKLVPEQVVETVMGYAYDFYGEIS